MAIIGLKSAIALTIIIPLVAGTALFFASRDVPIGGGIGGGVDSNGDPYIDEREHILVLTEKTFDLALKKYKSIMVNFFPSNSVCKTCHHVNQEFSEAAKIFLEEKEDDIRLAMVDVATEDGLRDRFNIKNYPTLRYFKRGEEDELSHGRYIGQWHSHSIVAWLRKKNGQSAYRKLHTQDEIEDFMQDNDAAVVGVFKNPDGPEARAFINASRQVLDDGVNFGLVIPSDEILAREFANTEQVAKMYIAKKTDELLVVYADKPYDSVEDIVRFVRLRAFPYVVEFSPGAEDIQKSFGHTDIHINTALFASKSSDGFQNLYNEFRTVAKGLRGEFGHRTNFVYVDTGNKENDDWLSFFEVEESDYPLVMIIVLDGRKLRYKLKRPTLPDGTKAPIDAKSIETLVRDFFDDKLDPDASSYRDEL